MSIVWTVLVYVTITATTVWILSFAPRFYAAERGVSVAAVLKDPSALLRRAIATPLPVLSFAFWRYLWKSRAFLEFVIAAIAVSTAWRAGSAFLKTLAAVNAA